MKSYHSYADPATLPEVECREFNNLRLKKLSPEQIDRLDPRKQGHENRHPVSLVVENVRSAHNVGAFLRTADALLLQHVYLTGYTPGGNHRGVNKAALGAQDTVPWTHHESPEVLIDQLKSNGYTIAALEITDSPSEACSLSSRQYPIALVVGNEVDGISDSVLGRCDVALELPQFGFKHSLNVAVAFGVMGYDLVRRWIELNKSVSADA